MEAIQESINGLMEMYKTQMAQFEGELQQLTSSSPDVTNLASQFTTFKVFILQSLNNLQKQVEMLAQNVDNLEMLSRRKILLLHGLAESKDEDTAKVVAKVIVTKLKLQNFNVECIRRCHRMGHADTKKQRPILVKFNDLTIKNEVWFAKSNLKGSGITLSEFLTKSRHDVFIAARRKFGISKTWTRDGSVFVVNPDGSRHRVNSLYELNNIPQSQPGASKPSTAKIIVEPAPKSKRPTGTRR